MREEIYRLLSPPERGTPKYWAVTAAREISNPAAAGHGFYAHLQSLRQLGHGPWIHGRLLDVRPLRALHGAIRYRTRDIAPEEVGWKRGKGRGRHLISGFGAKVTPCL